MISGASTTEGPGTRWQHGLSRISYRVNLEKIICTSLDRDVVLACLYPVFQISGVWVIAIGISRRIPRMRLSNWEDSFYSIRKLMRQSSMCLVSPRQCHHSRCVEVGALLCFYVVMGAFTNRIRGWYVQTSSVMWWNSIHWRWEYTFSSN